MKLDDWLKQSTAALDKAGILTARLDALVLLEDITGKDRAWLLAHPEFQMPRSDLGKLELYIKRRVMHEPLAYIRGMSEFYGREFIITKDTLQPRAETETMIDLLKQLVLKNPVIADIGSGSGCLAITASLELQDAKVYATEINTAALKIANNNAILLKAEVEFYQGNLLEPLFALSPMPNVLICNLPYVPTGYPINQAATHEPKIAIYGGQDGLGLFREMFAQTIYSTQQPQAKPIYILTESLLSQHIALAAIAKKHGYSQTLEQDLIQVFTAI